MDLDEQEWDINNQYKITIKGKNKADKVVSFNDSHLALNEIILGNITQLSLIEPTPIQCCGMPQIAAGLDVMCISCTGTGKTATFMLPILNEIYAESLIKSSGNEEKHVDGSVKDQDKTGCSFPKMLVMAPTRELAEQIRDDARKYVKGLPVSILAVFGGVGLGHQKRLLEGGNVDVLVATPGRLEHLLIEFAVLSLKRVKYLVFDEADEMFSKGFFPKINDIVRDHMNTKETRVTAMFSATFPYWIQEYAKKHLRSGHIFITVGTIGGASPDVLQKVVPVSEIEKQMKLCEFIEKESEKKILVFCNTIEKVDALVRFLEFKEMKVSFIHSLITQPERDQTIRDVNLGISKVVIATSVAARGLNITELAYVINFDMPKDISDYVQRVGRARTCGDGQLGVAVSFFDVSKDYELVKDLMFALKSANQDIPEFLMDIASTNEPEEEFPDENEDIIRKMKKFHISSVLYDVSERDAF